MTIIERSRYFNHILTGFFNFNFRCFKQEQMSLCVRYTVGLNIVERFLGFIDVSDKQDAESLSAHIFAYLTKNNMDTFHVVAQSYDGANVMSGKFNGVQAKIKNKFPYAIYTHCMAHRINLVVIDMCKYVKLNCNFL